MKHRGLYHAWARCALRACTARTARSAALLLALWAALLPAQAARLALVIGNDSYEQVSRLRNARADAQTMAEAMQAVGYEVMLRTDRSQREMLDDVRALRQRIRGGDEVVLFFSGHGVQLGASNHLLPINVRNQNEEQVRDDALELTKVLADIRAARPAFTLAIVDACRDNPFAGNASGRTIGGRGLTGVAGASGQMVIYAAGEGQQALDRLGNADRERNGLFTRVFARQMRQPGQPVHQVLRNVRGEVARLARSVGHEQVPAIYDQVEGDFFFVAAATNPVPNPQPASAPQPAGPKPGDVIKDCAVCPELVVIPGGSFVMGSPNNEPSRQSSEGPQREVGIASVAVGRYELTFEEWDACVADKGCSHRPNDEGWGRGRRPVINVSWNDAQGYLRWLSGKTGKGYRLLSEAEWEYAARGGTQTAYAWGDEVGRGQANCFGCGSQWDDKGGAPVGSFKPNAFGLYDMHGNVWEWVQDVVHADYAGAPPGGQAWMEGGRQERRVIRGGSSGNEPRDLRSAKRDGDAPDSRYPVIGVRIARNL